MIRKKSRVGTKWPPLGRIGLKVFFARCYEWYVIGIIQTIIFDQKHEIKKNKKIKSLRWQITPSYPKIPEMTETCHLRDFPEMATPPSSRPYAIGGSPHHGRWISKVLVVGRCIFLPKTGTIFELFMMYLPTTPQNLLFIVFLLINFPKNLTKVHKKLWISKTSGQKLLWSKSGKTPIF